MVLIMGLAVLPNGQPCLSDVVGPAAVGDPTRSMMTVVVRKNDAIINHEKKTLKVLYKS